MLDELRRLAEFADPRNIVQLRKAGVLTGKDPLGLLAALPWLLGRGQSLGVLAHAHSVAIPDKVAVTDRAGSLTFKELDARVNQTAHMLADLGVEGGDRVALLVRNGREWMEIVLACQKLGLISCPLNTWAKPQELKSTIGSSDPKLLVYETKHSDQVAECAPGDLPSLWIGDSSKALKRSRAYEEEIAGRSTAPPAPYALNRGKAKVVIHTSGTTGAPRGAMRDAAAAGIGSMAAILSIVPYHRNDIIVCPAPLFHSFGLLTFTFATVLGMTLVLPERFDPEQTLALIDEHDATALSGVPVMIRRMVNLEDRVKERYDLSSLRIVLASGSAMSADLRKAVLDTFGEVLYDLYGSTEAGWVSIANPADMRKHPSTVGKPAPGVDIAVFSEEGEKVGFDEVGELYIRSNITFEGYTNADAGDERDGYMSIGDTVRVNEEGYIFVEGRADDMVVVGGENIYPIEIENVIESIDGVEEAAVLGIEDEEYGHVLAAFVKGRVVEGKVEKTCKSELASYKVPRRIFVMDDFPRTGTGKVLKRELKEYAGHESLDGREGFGD